MNSMQPIKNFEELRSHAERSGKALVIFLEPENYQGLMSNVFESLLAEPPQDTELIRLSAEYALGIQSELSILTLPAVIILIDQNILAIYQGLVGPQEIKNIINNHFKI